MPLAHGNAQKTTLLVIVAVAILGVAGFVGFKHFSEGAAESSHQSMLDSGNTWRQKVAQLLNRQPEKFNGVSIQVGPPDYKPKVKVVAEIGGRVPTQAAMDELNKILTENPCPVAVEMSVTVAKGK